MNLKFNKLEIFCCLILASHSLLYGEDFNKVGTTGYVFLQIPVSSRHMALGETGITLPDVASEGMFINPALIALSEQKYSLNVAYSSWYIETTHQAAGFSYNLSGVGTIGLQAIYFDFGEIEKTRNPMPTEYGSYISMGTYRADAYALGITFARKLTNQFSFGSTIKYVKETIDIYKSDNVIADIGFLYYTGFKSFRIGAFLQNFGLDAKYVDEKFKMPQQLKLGFSAEVWGELQNPNHLTLLFEAAHPNDLDEHLQFGLENVWLNTLVLRAGYKLGYDDENLTLGLGLRFVNRGFNFTFDAAYMKHEQLDSTIRYSLSMEF